tara:strand:- start:2985 stop:4169 length:1185 start_codon:yes stop_codon:yes gene_type:complete
MFKKIFYKILFKITYITLGVRKERLVLCREDRIGHQAGGLDVQLYKTIRIKEKLNVNTRFVFYEKDHIIANKYLRKKFLNQIDSLGFKFYTINHDMFFSNFLYKLINFSIGKLQINSRIKYASTDIGKRSNINFILKSNNHFEICEKLNINPNKYICIYSRDDNYLVDKCRDINWDYHNYRNSDINNFKTVSLHIMKELGWSIVRVGSNPKKKISWETSGSPRIVDYSFSGFHSAQNDIELISGCNLYFSNGGGPESVAIASRRNIIKLNQIPIGDEHLNNFGIWLPKLHKRTNTEKYLNLSEICKINLQKSYFSEDYVKLGIDLCQNEAGDILNAFLDYLKYKNSTFSEDDKKVIEKYHKVRKIIFEKWGILINKNNFIAPSFLMKYKYLLDL